MKTDADWMERLNKLDIHVTGGCHTCLGDEYDCDCRSGQEIIQFVAQELTAARADERKKMVDAVMRNDLLEEAANAVEQRFNHKTMTPKDAGVIDICAGVIRSLKQ